MTEKITFKQVKAVADRLVEERGEGYKYEHPTEIVRYTGGGSEEQKIQSCVYADRGGTPSCIVGVIASEMAPDLFEILTEGEWNENGSLRGSHSVVRHAAEIGEFFTNEAYLFLRVAQREQDVNASWAMAVEVASGWVSSVS